MLNVLVGAGTFMAFALLWTLYKAPSNIRLAQSKILPGGYRQEFLEDRGTLAALGYILVSGVTMMIFSGVLGAIIGYSVAEIRGHVTRIKPTGYAAQTLSLSGMRTVDSMSGQFSGNIFIMSGSMQGELVYRYRFIESGGLRDGWVSPENADVLLKPEDRQDGILETWRCKDAPMPKNTLQMIYVSGECPFGYYSRNGFRGKRFIFHVPNGSIDTSIQIK